MTIEADCEKDKQEFLSKLSIYKDKKLEQFDINNEKDATAAKQVLDQNANGRLTVKTVDKKERNVTLPRLLLPLPYNRSRYANCDSLHKNHACSPAAI